LGNVDFGNLFVVLKNGASGASYITLEAAKGDGAVTMNIGVFLNVVIAFFIVAFAVFLMIKAINKLRKTQEAPAAPVTTKDCPFCFTKIPVQAVKCPNCTADLK
jgi:large conductance mechanosensitive channel